MKNKPFSFEDLLTQEEQTLNPIFQTAKQNLHATFKDIKTKVNQIETFVQNEITNESN